jgi:inosine-uridine nucleoside N-ribohydrolase
LLGLPAVGREVTSQSGEPPVRSRIRVIVDNDYGGDPDGLFQLAHHLLSPSVEVRGIIGSHHYPAGFYGYPGTPEHAVAMATELLGVMNMTGSVPVLRGAGVRLDDPAKAIPSDGARFIIEECLREDTKSPLYVVCGAGLTDVASACLMEPRIAGRMTLVWIGGPEHEGSASPPPGPKRVEYNLGIDIKAAQVIFNQTEVAVWQIPRNTYRQALVSSAELRRRVGGEGRLGGYLSGRLDDLMKRAKGALGEGYVLGDNPLVLMTALQSSWEPDPSSSDYTLVAAPRVTGEGEYEKRSGGREIRVYQKLDTRVMFEDLYAKIALFHEDSTRQE